MANFLNINPDSEIIIDGQCKQGCSSTSPLSYSYKIYFGYNPLDPKTIANQTKFNSTYKVTTTSTNSSDAVRFFLDFFA